MSDIDLIGKIIAECLFDNGSSSTIHQSSSLTQPKFAETFADTIVISSDNQKFEVHKVIIQARWSNLPFEKCEEDSNQYEWQLNLDLPSHIVSLLLDYLCYRPLVFPNLDAALQLYTFASETSNHHLQKLCMDGIKEKITPIDVLKVWNYSKCHRLRNSVLDYVTYHFPSAFDTYEVVRDEFHSMSLNDVVHVLRQRKLNIHSERQMIKYAMSWVDANMKSVVDPLKAINTFVDCMRLQNDHAKHVIPHMNALNDKYSIEVKIPSVHHPKRIRRDLFVFFGLYNFTNPIAFFVDMDAQKLRRLSSMDNPLFEELVQVPNFTIADGTLYQVGGKAASSYMGYAKADCFAMDKNTLRWKRKSSIPRERAYSAVCSSLNGNIFIVGGHSLSPEERTKKVEMFDPKRNAWRNLPEMNHGRYKATAVYHEGNLFAIGGATSVELSMVECEVFQKECQTWLTLPSLKHHRSSHCSVIYGNYIYALGGRSLSDDLNSVERLSLDLNGSWKVMPRMISKRVNFVAEVFDNKIWVFGGEMHPQREHALEQTIEFFDGHSWHPFCTLPPDVKPLAALSWKNIPHPEMILKNELKPDLHTIHEDDYQNNNNNGSFTSFHGA